MILPITGNHILVQSRSSPAEHIADGKRVSAFLVECCDGVTFLFWVSFQKTSAEAGNTLHCRLKRLSKTASQAAKGSFPLALQTQANGLEPVPVLEWIGTGESLFCFNQPPKRPGWRSAAYARSGR